MSELIDYTNEIKSELKTIKNDLNSFYTELRAEFKTFRKERKYYFRWLMAITAAGPILLFIMMALGFHWF